MIPSKNFTTLIATLLIAFNSPQYSESISYIMIYTHPPANSMIYVNCWTNKSDYSSQTLSKNFTANGEFSLVYTPSYSSQSYDAYWCRAVMGNGILTRFPVFGSGVSRNSSEWLINYVGRRRISCENTPTNDYKAVWMNY